MLFENMSRSIRKEYNHRPLKKRPVHVSIREEEPPSPAVPYDEKEPEEPENLSTKPEDLSRTGNYPSSAMSPAIAAAPVPPMPVPRRWPEVAPSPPSPPCLPPYPQHIPVNFTQLAPHPHHLPSHIVTPVPTYVSRLSPRLVHYPPRPLEILNLNPHEQPWARTTPLYPACLPFPYGAPEQYNGLSPRAACSPPMHSPASMSPTSPTSLRSAESLSPQAARPKDLSSPVSVDSGISAESIPRRRRDPTAPRYQCADCGKSYSTYSGLTKHRQFHCAAAEGNMAKKSFSCKYCSKVYTSLGALKMHIRTHTLPCKCHLCGKAFSRPWLLQGHIRTHTGEKPFSCHHCRRAFADRSNLRAHLQTHSEVKKYSCASCSKTFSRMSLLTKHLEGGCPGYGPINPPHEYRPEEIAY